MSMKADRYYQGGVDLAEFADVRSGSPMPGFCAGTAGRPGNPIQLAIRPYSSIWPATTEVSGRGGYATGKKLSYSPIGTPAGQGCVAIDKNRDPITAGTNDLFIQESGEDDHTFRIRQTPRLDIDVLGTPTTLPAMLWIERYDDSTGKWTALHSYRADEDFASGEIPQVFGVRLQAGGGAGENGVTDGHAGGGGAGALWCGVVKVGALDGGYIKLRMGHRGYATSALGPQDAIDCAILWHGSNGQDTLLATIGGGKAGSDVGGGGGAGGTVTIAAAMSQRLDGSYVCWTGYTKAGNKGVDWNGTPSSTPDTTLSYMVGSPSALGFGDTSWKQGGYEDGNTYSERQYRCGGGGASYMGDGGNAAHDAGNIGGFGAGGGSCVLAGGEGSVLCQGGRWLLEFWY